MHVISLDLGGTKVASAIFNHESKMLFKGTVQLEKRKSKEVGRLIQAQIIKLFKIAESHKIKISSIGVCVPGIFWSKKGTVWAPNIPGWDDYPLLNEIKNTTRTLNKGDVKVKVDSDRACYILGEVWQGSAKGCKDAIFIAVGTGIGLGVLINGKVLRGANDIAGATGWMALDRPFRDEYISCGCFEYYASGVGIAKIAREYLNKGVKHKGILGQKDPKQITAHDVFTAFEKSDKLAQKVLREAIEFWGMAAANYISLFNPEKIIFGGGVFGPALKFLDEIMKEARKWAQPISINQVELVGSKLGGDAGLYGAGYLALKNR
jgi:glucokinase